MVLRLNIVIISSTLRAKEQLFWSEKIYHTVVKRSIPALRYSLCNSSQGNVQFSKQSGFQTCLKQMYGDKMNFSSSFTSKIQETFLLELLKCSFFAFFFNKMLSMRCSSSLCRAKELRIYLAKRWYSACTFSLPKRNVVII